MPSLADYERLLDAAEASGLGETAAIQEANRQFARLGRRRTTRRRTRSSLTGETQTTRLVTYQLVGVESTIEHLKIIGDKELPRELNRIIRDGLKPILADAKQRVPVRTGNLKSKLRIKASTGGRRISGGIRASTSKLRRHDYAAPIHWGWPKRNIEGSRFIWLAWEDGRNNFTRSTEERIEKWARRAEVRLNRNVNITTRRVLAS